MCQRIFELHAVDITCKNVHGSETPLVFRIIIRMEGEKPRQQKKIKMNLKSGF